MRSSVTRWDGLVATAPVSERAFRDFRQLEGRKFNFQPRPFEEAHADPEWRIDRREVALAIEPPGAPLDDGPYAAARQILARYQFADPSIVRAVFDPSEPLDGRNMLLVGRFYVLRFHMGVRIGGVADEQTEVEDRPTHRFRWNYRTLEGHLERGQMNYDLIKWADTGAVELRIRAYSQAADIDNPLTALGFSLFGRSVQLQFLEQSIARMRMLLAAQGVRPSGDGKEPISPSYGKETDMSERYDFTFDERFEGLLRPLGVRPSRASVTVDDRHLRARFGPWRVSTPVDNIRDVHLTGPHRPLKAIGPRFSLADRSLTFGSNADRTVRIEFYESVRGMEPLGVVKHPALVVSVTEPEALRDHLQTMIDRR